MERDSRRSEEREREDSANSDSNTKKIYIAHLKRETGKSDLLKEFEKYGPIAEITMKDHFAFIDF